MNKSEQLQNERMTFVSRRGRTAEMQRINWLRNLRSERSRNDLPRWVIFHRFGWQEVEGSLNHAKIQAHKLSAEAPEFEVRLLDAVTRIEIWSNNKNG